MILLRHLIRVIVVILVPLVPEGKTRFIDEEKENWKCAKETFHQGKMPLHYGPEQPRIQAQGLGYPLIHSLAPLTHTLTHTLIRFARPLHCTQLFAPLPIHSLPSL